MARWMSPFGGGAGNGIWLRKEAERIRAKAMIMARESRYIVLSRMMGMLYFMVMAC